MLIRDKSLSLTRVWMHLVSRIYTADEKEGKPMKWIADHFGEAAVAFAVLIALGVLITGLLVSGGVVDMQFQSALTTFFERMLGSTGAIA